MKKPYWKNAQFWICPKHLPSARFPATVAACWFAGCTSQRPPIKDESPHPIEPPKANPDPPSSAPLKSKAQSKSTADIKNELIQVVEAKSKKTEENTDSSKKLCAWIKCDKGPNETRNVASKRSKYCSRDCSNRNARANYNSRAPKPTKD